MAEKIQFYHIHKTHNLSRFLNGRTNYVGKGHGGQTDGFFVWTTRDKALEHIRFLNEELRDHDGLMVTVEVDKASVKSPEWGMDIEREPDLAWLMEQHTDEILTLKNVPFKLFDKDEMLDVVGKGEKFGTFQLMVHSMPKKRFTQSVHNDISVTWVGAFQAIHDRMCALSPDYLKGYNILMQNEVNKPTGMGLKYMGKKPLKVVELQTIHMKPDGSFDFTSTPIPYQQNPAVLDKIKNQR